MLDGKLAGFVRVYTVFKLYLVLVKLLRFWILYLVLIIYIVSLIHSKEVFDSVANISEVILCFFFYIYM